MLASHLLVTFWMTLPWARQDWSGGGGISPNIPLTGWQTGHPRCSHDRNVALPSPWCLDLQGTPVVRAPASLPPTPSTASPPTPEPRGGLARPRSQLQLWPLQGSGAFGGSPP